MATSRGQKLDPRLLYPLKYRIPFRSEVPTSSHDSTIDWIEFISSAVKHLSARSPARMVRDGWRVFSGSMSDPACALNNTIINFGSFGFFPGVSDEFLVFVEEIIRDGKVSAAESSLLEEKANEHGVDEETCNRILTLKTRYNSFFLRLVDAVCRDGTVTPAERTFLAEKAKEHGITSDYHLSQTIDRSLVLHTESENLQASAIFRELVSGMFLAKYGLHDPYLTDEFLYASDSFVTDYPRFSVASDQRDLLTEGMRTHLNRVVGTEYFESGLSIADMVMIISSITSDYEYAATVRSISRADAEMVLEVEGLTFLVQLSERHHAPLFWHDVSGTEVVLTVNTAHPNLVSADANVIKSIVRLSLSITLTRLQMYSDSDAFESFFDRMSVNDRVLANLID